MIADWWPDDWDFPVGYHVTVPCQAEDASYRSFHQAFGLAGVDAEGVPVLAYQQDLLRDGALVDSNFGAGGLCRTTNFGMETLGVNTMRYCTQVPKNPASDYTVATKTLPGDWGNWSCSASADSLPWPDYTVLSSPNTNTHEPNLYSVGTIPNMPQDGADYYPYNLDADMYDVGPWQDILADRGWGAGCSDIALSFCQRDADCPSTYTCEGLFCSYGDSLPCRTDADCQAVGAGECQGVCMAADVECTAHADCSDGKMCTGLGACVVPLLTVQNAVSTDDMAFQVNSERCPQGSTNYSMLGASYWAYVTNDILRVHGMCSYGDWYKYQTTIAQCSPEDQGSYWLIDPKQCHIIDFTGNSPNTTHWWDPSAVRPNVLYMHPTNCDRDYERLHLAGTSSPLQSCAPVTASVRSPIDGSMPLTFDTYAKMHTDTPAGPRVPIAKMPYVNDPKYGFLGIGAVASDGAIGSNFFQSCSTLDQCTASPFTVNGQEIAQRQYLSSPSASMTNYSQGDVFVCGVMGFQANGGCNLDLAISQLYNFFCVSDTPSSCRPLVPNLGLLCSNVLRVYTAGYTNVVANVAALNALFYAIPTPPDVPTYLATVDCMQDLHSFVSAQPYKNFYYVLDFVLYEFPFAWYYQCMVMSPTVIDKTSRVSQDCQAFVDRAAFTIDGYTPRSTNGDDAMTMLRSPRARGPAQKNVLPRH